MLRHRQIAILGFPGVGKSSIAHHFVYQHFYNGYDPNIKTSLQHRYLIGETEYYLTIIDNAGSDQYTIDHFDFENSDAYILVYAIDDLQSFKMVSKIRDKIMLTSTMNRVPIVLVGNKIDRNEERVVSSEDGRTLANLWKVQFVEASALDFKTVRDIFEKSIKAMDIVDFYENGTNENPSNSNLNEINDPSRSSNASLNKNPNSEKSNGKLSTKQNSSNKPCSIS